MKQHIARKAVKYGIVLLIIIWPVYQLLSMLGPHKEEHDATHLLYQVSLFQMELLNSYLSEAGQMKETGELNAIKQALYSAGYTHERLVLASGGNAYLTSLESLTQLTQYIQRLQVGGERPLKTDELQTLKEAGTQYKNMYSLYEKMMASSGRIVSSQNSKLIDADHSLTSMIRKKMLQ
ncbi:S-adenosylmethionine decarboxylase [Paenibacillus sp. N3.4]|uniref:S-adenosylmethionine decarboxylase n=1 Tax=Paenibacillus sp. N3.4 TaxID=2603222 RepID=UPI00164EDE62|nr:S-adenosylmethionine decarboxylase [Paenibacillus sp. N3.4]